ncbi:MAG: diacylglycerol kinase family lipid kinase, partial [Bacteroidaceae bacterium]|nr:diacylglycerol kinase family lipid kinase [Bacteroidaceae bacterium]
MKSVRFIINPISGTASKLNLAPLIDANINGKKLAYDIQK